MTAVVLVWLDGPDVYVSDVTGTPRPVAAGHARTLAGRADLLDKIRPTPHSPSPSPARRRAEPRHTR